MRTQDERIRSLHLRMERRRRMLERRRTGVIGTAVAAVSACLVLAIGAGNTPHHGGTAGMYSGAAMLFADVGAYVLVALLAFMAGVVVTAFLIRRRQASGDRDDPAVPGTGEENRKRRDEEEPI